MKIVKVFLICLFLFLTSCSSQEELPQETPTPLQTPPATEAVLVAQKQEPTLTEPVSPTLELPTEEVLPMPTRSSQIYTPTLDANASLPPARSVGFAYDKTRGEIVAFGGMDIGRCNPCAETWTWDGNGWTQRLPDKAPSPRWSPSLVYDPNLQKVILFGGVDEYYYSHNDFWSWDGETWKQVPTQVVPTPRAQPLMGFDILRQEVVLFGGYWSEKGEMRFLNDTWAWSGQEWQARESGSISNGANPQPGMAYDAARQQMVLWQYETGTWIWDGLTWTNLPPASGPDLYTQGILGYDEASQKVILWTIDLAHKDSLIPQTWAWDGSNWTQLDTGGNPGPNSPEASLLYDTRRNSLLLIAAVGDKSAYHQSIWRWTGNGWEQIG